MCEMCTVNFSMTQLEHIFEQVFGTGFVSSNITASSNTESSPRGTNFKHSHTVENVKQNVDQELQRILPNSEQKIKEKPPDQSDLNSSLNQEGRVGNDHVVFDVTAHTGVFVVGNDHLTIKSQSNFSTIRANCGVYKGKWQYEAELLSSGIMQLGWATVHSKFSETIGVGDTSDSYAFDGCRVRKWNVSTYKYGEQWSKNDVIGCCIDLDEGAVEFFRNGISLGNAFNNILMGQGIAYFPTVSLALLEHLVANFGSKPFSYPVTGYHPLQGAPKGELLQSSSLLTWMSKLLSLKDNIPVVTDGEMSSDAAFLLVGQIIMTRLIPLLSDRYVVEAKFLPFLRTLCEQDPSPQSSGLVRPSARAVSQRSAICASKRKKLMYLIDLVMAFSTDHELKMCMEAVMNSLTALSLFTSMVLDFSSLRAALLVLTNLVRHKQLRHYLIQNLFFDNNGRFSRIMQGMILKESVVNSQPWWDTNHTDIAIETNKKSYMASVSKVKAAILGVREMQIELIFILLDNTDGSETEPSSRRIFLHKFRFSLLDNLSVSGGTQIRMGPSIFRLLSALRKLWAKEVGNTAPPIVPTTTFYDGSINYHNIERLGGVLSHLVKKLRPELEQRLGSSHPSLQTPSTAQQNPCSGPQAPVDSSTSTPNTTAVGLATGFSGGVGFVLPMLARLLSQPGQAAEVHTLLTDYMGLSDFTPSGSGGGGNPKPGNMDARASLVELIDGLVLLSNICGVKDMKMFRSTWEKMDKYIKGLEEVQVRIDAISASPTEQPPEILKELQSSHCVFYQHLVNLSRVFVCIDGNILSNEAEANLTWLLKVVLATIQAASEEGPMLKFVPYFYLDTLEIFDVLGTLTSPLAPLEDIPDHEELICGVVQYICDHINDERIRIAKTKDTIIKCLTNFMTKPERLQALHMVSVESRMNMLRFLLQPYENRPWAHSNWVLVRIWQGSPDAFGFRSQHSPHHRRKLRPKPQWELLLSSDFEPCPSFVLQAQLREILLSEPNIAIPFINSILNQLNWAFSEFVGMLQEIQNVSNRQERVLIESRQLKICATCFDLTVSLLRVIEMVAFLALPIFIDPDRPNSNLMLSRICQLLCQVLNRVSSQSGCFHHITVLNISDLENVDHFPILSAVSGVLLALLAEDLKTFSGSADSTVPPVTKELLTEPSFQMSSLTFILGDNSQLFSLKDYNEDVSLGEIDQVQCMLNMLESYHHISNTETASCDSEGNNMCTICYAYPMSATFEPCSHQSCRACISHHLMNNKECFFCKADITKVVDDDGKVLFEPSIQFKNSSHLNSPDPY